ncbi:uncharacterized protein K452DRAFT_301498 [Aplosporella prunicola CBS 121167]|uniref:ATP synthase mitochondrial F1 complex assembly factor 2 n=1 Tax=Aplosporella prunicola CBS 121167 TaxID=1176127 RepID=A0A6A6B3F3_9PEZI|nr:uncharacterized protein K452DRAFT_301498 [Aplosporella prunicola CBS 121167]KAF2138138.1 hypothetical protein K452DRAFT_301498 [Aplosporella prunicola CBS 121167]
MMQPISALVRRARPASSFSAIRRCLHTSSSWSAKPIPHPAAPGPPPGPPKPAATTPEERIARKQRQAELLKKGQSIKPNPAKPASALQKRFWKDVHVKQTPEGFQVLLDSRPVRTASKGALTLPPNKHQLATAIALEWDLLVSAQQALKQHYIPLTSLTSRAIDIQTADAAGDSSIRDSIVKIMMNYLSTDTLLCWAPERSMHDAVGLEQSEDRVESLREVQKRTAEPILKFLTTKIWPGVEILPTLEPDSILPTPQPQKTRDVIRGWLAALPAWELAGLERGVLASKSLLVGARLLVEWSPEFSHLRENEQSGGRFGIQEAADASTLEVTWQTAMWGEVEDTHDVDKEDVRRQLGSVIVLVNG